MKEYIQSFIDAMEEKGIHFNEEQSVFKNEIVLHCELKKKFERGTLYHFLDEGRKINDERMLLINSFFKAQMIYDLEKTHEKMENKCFTNEYLSTISCYKLIGDTCYILLDNEIAVDDDGTTFMEITLTLL